MSETTLQKVEAEVQKLTAELESVERAQVIGLLRSVVLVRCSSSLVIRSSGGG